MSSNASAEPTMAAIAPRAEEIVTQAVVAGDACGRQLLAACRRMWETVGAPQEDKDAAAAGMEAALLEAGEELPRFALAFALCRELSETNRLPQSVENLSSTFPDLVLPPTSEAGGADHFALLRSIYTINASALKRMLLVPLDPYVQAGFGLKVPLGLDPTRRWHQLCSPGFAALPMVEAAAFLTSETRALFGHFVPAIMMILAKAPKVRRKMASDTEIADALTALATDLSELVMATKVRNQALCEYYDMYISGHLKAIWVFAQEDPEAYRAHVSSDARTARPLPDGTLLDPARKLAEQPRGTLFGSVAALEDALKKRGGRPGGDAARDAAVARMALARIAFPDKFAAEMGKEAATFVSTVGVGMSNSGPMGNAALCGECGAKATKDKKLQQCSRCHATWYCSRECQKEAWKLHKDRCGKEGDEVIQLGESLNTAPAATSKS